MSARHHSNETIQDLNPAEILNISFVLSSDNTEDEMLFLSSVSSPHRFHFYLAMPVVIGLVDESLVQT